MIFGHDNILEKFSTMMQTKIPHSLILSGKKGIGKYSLAKYIAKSILSYNVGEFPIIKGNIIPPIDDNIAKLIDNSVFRNFLLIHPAWDEKKQIYKNIITVDEIRKIKDFMHTFSIDNKYKIIIIDAVDNMNINASNALLKNLEEPSKNTLFILISHNYTNLPDTIKSRCINIKCNSLSSSCLREMLIYNNIDTTDINLDTVLSLAEGSYADLLWYLNSDNIKILKVIQALMINMNDIDIINFINKNSFVNMDLAMIFKIIKNILLAKITDYNLNDINSIISSMDTMEKNLISLNLDKNMVLSSILFLINNAKV